MVHSLNKGKSFERWVAKYLSKQTGIKWHRVPMSGGFATQHKSLSTEFTGDVFTEDNRYKSVTVECKAHKELKITELFNLNSKLFNWIKQTEEESKDNECLLFFKINRLGTYVCFESSADYPTLKEEIVFKLNTKDEHIVISDEQSKFENWTIKKIE